jgi:DNA polymerase III subunit delta
MSAAAQRALHKAITTGSFDRAYLFYGENDFLKDAAARQIIDRAVDPGVRDFNVEIRRGAEVDAEVMESLLGTPPMMADQRVVVLRDVGALKKPARAALDRYLANPAPDAVLVLVSAAGPGAPDKGLEAKTTAVEFPILTEDRTLKWITHRVTTELGGRITPGAAALLLEAIGTDLPQIASEIDKLMSYADGAEIDEAAVSAIVGIRHGETMADVLDAVAARDAVRAIDLLPHVLSQPKTSAVSIVMALTTQMLALAWGRVLRDEGRSSSEVERAYFQLLKDSNAMTGRPWGDAIRCWGRALDSWTSEELSHAVDALLMADVALKESRVSSDEQTLVTLILSICRSR